MASRLIHRKIFDCKRQFTLMLPQNSVLLCTAILPSNQPCVFYEFEDGLQDHLELRTFRLVGLNDKFTTSPKERMDFVGSIVMYGGNYIAHLYELRPY
jgi:hypothetical protein